MNGLNDKKRVHCPELEKMLAGFPKWIGVVQILLCVLFGSLLLLAYRYIPFLFG